MNNTLAELYANIYVACGSPEDDLLDRKQLANILLRRLSYRLEAVRQSPQRESVAKTVTFTLASDSDEKNLTTLDTNLVIPLWCEAQTTSYVGNPVWTYIPTVNLSTLAEQRQLAVPSVAFYGGNPTEVKAKFSFYGNEVWAPFSSMRVWYTPVITLPDTEDTLIELPDNLVSMVYYDAMVSALPMMMTNAAKQMDKRPELAGMSQSWQFLLGELKEERAEFERYFELWRRKSRGGSRPTMRSDVLQQVIPRGGRFPFFVNNSGN